MKEMRTLTLLCGTAVSACGLAVSQIAAPTPSAATTSSSAQVPQSGNSTNNSAIVANLVTLYKANKSITGGLEIFQEPDTYVTQIGIVSTKSTQAAAQSAAKSAATTANTASVANAVQQRTDQQTTAPSGSPGSTSTTNQGSAPSLLSIATETGALTQSVSGNTTTVQANLPNVIKAINGKKFMDFYRSEPSNRIAQILSTTSLAASFNTGTSSSSTSTSTSPSLFSSVTAHIDFINHRDPRDRKWFNKWNDLSNGPLQALANAVPNYQQEFQNKMPTQYAQWKTEAQAELAKLAAIQNPTDSQITASMTTLLTDFESMLYTASTQQYADDYNKALGIYTTADAAVLNSISTSFVFSFEYTFVNQSSVALPKSTTQTYALGTTAPDLSTFNLIFSGANLLGIKATLTGNASATLFTAPSAQLQLAPVRDYKVSGELDLPIPPIAGSKKSTIAISGLFQDLIQEPLGQAVTVNGVSVSTRGNIWLGQGKWSIPIGTTGVTIPFSVTGSNRTDLIKETDVKGSFGISYNLDSLFAKQ